MAQKQSELPSGKVLDVAFNKRGFTGMERVILTSDGNLQRTMSPVTMEIVRFDRLGETDNFDREVVLKCKGKTFCRASTKLQVTSPEVLSLLVEKEMGFGQIFRYLQRIPQFSLLDCGKDDKKLWRHYTLTIPEGMHMVITEVFPASIFELNFDDGEEKFTKEVWDSVPDVQV